MWFIGLLLRCMTAESLLPFKKRCLLKLHSVEPLLLADTRRRVTTAARFVIAVLHTWGQKLSLHPNIDCLVPAAGYSLDGRWKNINFYTHRVAITNQRIVNVTDEKVAFIARDYRQGAAKKCITLGGVEFLRRFAQHILPRRFVKIRRYGIYNHTVKRNLGIRHQSMSLSGV